MSVAFNLKIWRRFRQHQFKCKWNDKRVNDKHPRRRIENRKQILEAVKIRVKMISKPPS